LHVKRVFVYLDISRNWFDK